MANSVENRVVRLEFDNAAFEKKLANTIRSLGDLDKAFQMKGAAKGLSDASDAVGRFNLNPLKTSVQNVSAGFLALSTIAITALSRITNAAITYGAQTVKALSLDPVLDGFREYELNIGSIQTILANTKADGTNLQDVNRALDELNTYADKTIYNFAEMTRNIGTFTAAGVDLDTSVRSIKGIANLAAISGSSSQQASVAMYQLSQAIATGTLKLIDWNSVVNAGLGGEVFQKALFESGKAMGTLNDVPIDQTFEEWTKAGNSFRESLQDGWITADVLTTTLEGFTGELTESQLKAKGYTKEQIATIKEMGKLGVESATKVRTLTQLVSTVQESLGSGWALTFRTLVGDFKQATELFTSISESITKFTDKVADSRNRMLEGWANFGGRELLIDTLAKAFSNLGKILGAIGRAFRNVFPPLTSARLVELTIGFSNLIKNLTPAPETIEKIERIFTGLFSALSIGGTIIKEIAIFLKDLFVEITGFGNGNILSFLANFGDFFTNLRSSLRNGEAIADFFDNLAEKLQKPIDFLQDLRKAIFGLFDGFDESASEAAGSAVDRLSQRFEGLAGVFKALGGVGEFLAGAFNKIIDALQPVTDAIGEWLDDLKQRIADAFGPGDFDAVLDALNTSLLGGIAVILAKFLKGGINLDFGGGLFDKIKDTFGELTGVLKAMQTQIKAEALLKIAGAVGILTASVLVLSLIDSAALTKALTAMAVGFAQLLGAFAILQKLSISLTGAGSFTVIATGMILMSTAVLILSAAVAVLASLSWGDLAKGLLAVTVLLGILTASTIILSKNAGSVLLASASMIAMAVALNILAGAVKIFATMSWSELAKGMAGVAAGLLIMAGALRLMPSGLILQGVGLIFVATALNILATAVKAFAAISWGDMLHGMVGIAAALVVIGLAMRAMPGNLILVGVGLIAVSVALNIIAKALMSFGSMSWGEIGKGLVVLGASLLILALAVNAMQSAVAGAAAMILVSVAVGILSKSLIELAKVKGGDIAKALIALAAAFVIFIAAAAAITNLGLAPALLALGAALLLVGAGFALFGVGAYATAKAFEILAKTGPKAAKGVTEALKAIAKALPSLLQGLAEGIIDLIQVFIDAAPVFAKAFKVILETLLDTVQDILPKVGEVFLTLIETILKVISEAYPQLVEAAIGLILALLTGIRDNIYQVVDLALEIIQEFLRGIADNIGLVIAAGTQVIVNFLNGLAQNVGRIAEAAGNLIRSFIMAVAGLQQDVINAGVQVLVNFLLGIGNNLAKVVRTVGKVIAKFISAVGGLAKDIAKAGTDALVDFLEGITNNLEKIVTAVGKIVTKFINAVSDQSQKIIKAGADAIIDLIEGLGKHGERIARKGVDAIIKFIEGVGRNANRLARAAFDVVITFLNELAATIEQKSGELRAAGRRIATAIADGITGGWASRAGGIVSDIVGTAKSALGSVGSFLGIGSPSKEFHKIGAWMAEGMALGIRQDRSAVRESVRLGERTTAAILEAIAKAAEELDRDMDVVPTITPVLDLTKVREEAASIDGLVNPFDRTITPVASFNAAQDIATTTVPVTDENGRPEGATGVSFTQNNYSPEALSTADIYKNTRNQISLAKEELKVA